MSNEIPRYVQLQFWRLKAFCSNLYSFHSHCLSQYIHSAFIMYSRIQGPHSPLSPMPQQTEQNSLVAKNLLSIGKVRNLYFSPVNNASHRLNVNTGICRTFTPGKDQVTPPTVSPIDTLASSDKENAELDSTFIVSDGKSFNGRRSGSDKKLKLHIPSPRMVPQIILSEHDRSDSDVSVYYTPPTEFAVIEKIRSANSSAPR